MLPTKCFIYLCLTICQDLVANIDGGYKYSEPYVQSVDKVCLENQNKK